MTEHLSRTQRRMLLELLVALAKADGRVAELEREVLSDYGDLLGVPLDEVDGNFDVEELAPYFDTPASRVVAIEELCRVARLDEHFADDERAAILDVAGAMGVGPDFVSRIDEWVNEGLRWVAHGQELIDEAERTLD